MSLPARSPEFARLATRWLEGSATAAEAGQLWESVMEDKACAKEFADQARFELLLQDTLREQLREQGIAAAARVKTVTFHRRATVRRALAAAATLAFAGYLLWLVLPADHIQKMPETVQATSPPAPVPTPRSMPNNTMVLIARQLPSQPAEDTPPDSLQKQLDQFFLTGVDLDKVPLGRALKMLEDQLRELNFANKAELAALHVLLPPGAGAQPVTFHSGSISFLKAVRALAALAGYDVNADDTSVSLLARGGGNPLRQESRSLNTLLTRLGTTSDPSRNRLTELFNDARSLGLQLNSSLDENGNIVGLQATPGQFEALALMAQSRDQIRGMPPLIFYPRVSRSQPDAQNRILTGPEAQRERAEFDFANGPIRPAPIIVPLQEFVPVNIMAGETVELSATPVAGNNAYLRINANTKKKQEEPIVALLDSSSRGREVITVNISATNDTSGGITLATSGTTATTASFSANTATLSTVNAFNNQTPNGSIILKSGSASLTLDLFRDAPPP